MTDQLGESGDKFETVPEAGRYLVNLVLMDNSVISVFMQLNGGETKGSILRQIAGIIKETLKKRSVNFGQICQIFLMGNEPIFEYPVAEIRLAINQIENESREAAQRENRPGWRKALDWVLRR